MSIVLKPPSPLVFDRSLPSVFLAGSIDMGAADDWQRRFEESLADARGVVLNPRRDAWEPTWRQSIDDANLREQVEWELAAQEMATAIVMYFSPTTKAPITLLGSACSRALERSWCAAQMASGAKGTSRSHASATASRWCRP